MARSGDRRVTLRVAGCRMDLRLPLARPLAKRVRAWLEALPPGSRSRYVLLLVLQDMARAGRRGSQPLAWGLQQWEGRQLGALAPALALPEAPPELSPRALDEPPEPVPLVSPLPRRPGRGRAGASPVPPRSHAPHDQDEVTESLRRLGLDYLLDEFDHQEGDEL
jgi:hypothetical protein